MTDERCDRADYCARINGHAGCCTARPTAPTPGWDRSRDVIAQRHIDAAVTLVTLDFPAPFFADLLDDVADAVVAVVREHLLSDERVEIDMREAERGDPEHHAHVAEVVQVLSAALGEGGRCHALGGVGPCMVCRTCTHHAAGGRS